MVNSKNQKEESQVSLAQFVYPFIRPHILTIVFSVIAMSIYALTTSAYAYLAGPILKMLLWKDSNPFQENQWFGENFLEKLFDVQSLSQISLFVVIILVLSVIRSIAQSLEAYFVGKAGQNIQMDIRNAFGESILGTLPLGLLKARKGDMVTRLIADINMMEMAITHAAASILRDGLQTIFLCCLLFYLNPVVSLIAIVVLPAGTLVVYAIAKKIRRAFKQAFDKRGYVASVFMEVARGLPVIKIFSAEQKIIDKLKSANMLLRNQMIKGITLQALSYPVIEIITTVAFLMLVVISWNQSKEACDNPERLISFFATVLLLMRPVKSLGSLVSFLQQGIAATRRVQAMFVLQKDVSPGALKPSPLQQEITLKDVCFSYEGREILSGVNLVLRRGEITALVGESGAGKTTLIELICGFLRAASGNIFWDGMEYEKFDTVSLRERISLVPQEPFLINASIEENILLGRNESFRKNLDWAVDASGLQSLLKKLPDGLKTSVEEEGSSLSTGEKQRICIARALISDCDLVIFDEAASSLDSRAEDAIQETIEKIKGQKTILIVSHRLSTINFAKRVFVLAGGKIVETGTCGELSKQGTEFYKLFRSQIER